MKYASHSTIETQAIAAQLAATLRGGETIALIGDLGAGKTTFAQGFCAALGVTATVTSPTFAIMNVYEGRFRVVHLDLYRLKSAREIAALGLEEYLGQPDTVALIEWPEAVDGVQWNANVTVRLSAEGESERTIDISYGDGGDTISAGGEASS
ncbi:MAG: tRNA (adenosine(37)-N6)-threonylcarbamoyltransferase complex ATPase subunit type 1 TsaE [Candidatus Uhrbacteria bacterium]